MKNFPLFALNDDDHTHTNDTESGTKSKGHTLSFYCVNDGLKSSQYSLRSCHHNLRKHSISASMQRE